MAREEKFPGSILLIEDLPVEGVTDLGPPDTYQPNVIVLALREILPEDLRGKPVIYLRYLSGRSKKEYLAILAHELGHWEQGGSPYPMIDPRWIEREVDAMARGFKWARKWEVLPEYFEAVRRVNEGLRSMGLPELPSISNFLRDLGVFPED